MHSGARRCHYASLCSLAARMMTANVAPFVPRSLFAQRVLPCKGVRVVGVTVAPAERMMALGGGNVGMLAVRMMGAECAGVSTHAKRTMMNIVARVAAVLHSIEPECHRRSYHSTQPASAHSVTDSLSHLRFRVQLV